MKINIRHRQDIRNLAIYNNRNRKLMGTLTFVDSLEKQIVWTPQGFQFSDNAFYPSSETRFSETPSFLKDLSEHHHGEIEDLLSFVFYNHTSSQTAIAIIPFSKDEQPYTQLEKQIEKELSQNFFVPARTLQQHKERLPINLFDMVEGITEETKKNTIAKVVKLDIKEQTKESQTTERKAS